jgi:polyhydroxyalkanoate synthesis regulator protein
MEYVVMNIETKEIVDMFPVAWLNQVIAFNHDHQDILTFRKSCQKKLRELRAKFGEDQGLMLADEVVNLKPTIERLEQFETYLGEYLSSDKKYVGRYLVINK